MLFPCACRNRALTSPLVWGSGIAGAAGAAGSSAESMARLSQTMKQSAQSKSSASPLPLGPLCLSFTLLFACGVATCKHVIMPCAQPESTAIERCAYALIQLASSKRARQIHLLPAFLGMKLVRYDCNCSCNRSSSSKFNKFVHRFPFLSGAARAVTDRFQARVSDAIPAEVCDRH